MIDEKMEEILGSELSGVISSIFKRMDIAEDEIAKGQKRWPKSKDVIWGAFGALVATDPIREFPDKLYRAHCAELIDRVGDWWLVDDKDAKIDLSLATDAELCGACSTASLGVPLSQDAQLAYINAFERIFGEDILDHEWASREQWPGHAEEAERKLKSKLVQEWRILYWNKDMRGWHCTSPDSV